MFITIYGINNLGKSTQAKLLVEKIKNEGLKAEYIKYPHYEEKPFGKLINDYLRHNNPFNLSTREAQLLYVLDRVQYQETLINKLKTTHIVAEDYTGTGICWGISTGVDENFLKQINSNLLKEDIAFLLVGNRFLDSRESNHKHEQNNELIDFVQKTHQEYGKQNNWIEINANQSIEQIAEFIWDIVKQKF